jgi:hypothetical protein
VNNSATAVHNSNHVRRHRYAHQALGSARDGKPSSRTSLSTKEKEQKPSRPYPEPVLRNSADQLTTTTMTIKTAAILKSRTTQQLTGTHAKVAASLDYDSVLGIAWAQRVLKQGGPQATHVSGIVRRALQLYLRHLAGADLADEYRAVARASKVLNVPEQDQQAASARLHAEPLQPFAVVRHGPQAVAETAALHARLNAL